MAKRKWKKVQVVGGYVGQTWAKAGDVLYWENSLNVRTVNTMVRGAKTKRNYDPADWPPKRVRITVEVEVDGN